jgi:DNA polymerase-3 subunit alpha
MLKIDALSSRTLTVVDMTLELIADRYDGRSVDFPADDPATYDLLCTGDVVGIFQLGARWGRELILRMQPRCFEDLMHLTSMGRPGVIDAGTMEAYFRARETGDIQYLHPALEPLLEGTYGVALYQETVMLIATNLAGFSWSEADGMRKAIGSKDAGRMASMRDRFIDGCETNSIPRDAAEQVWETIRHFSGYGFNKSHAAAYADLTYKTAYLKANYPIEYYTALLTFKADDADDRRQFIADARRHGIQVRPPDINASTDRYAIAGDAICLPLTAVSWVGPVGYEAITRARADGRFESYDDFFERVAGRAVNSRARGNLIKAGAFDELHPQREELLRSEPEIRDEDLLVLDHRGDGILTLEHSVLGIYVSGHPLDGYDYGSARRIGEVAELPAGSEFVTVGSVAAVKEHKDKNERLMAFLTLGDRLDQVDVTIFADDYDRDLEIGTLIHFCGWVTKRGINGSYEILDRAQIAAQTVAV